jgi:hypothetical protein
MSAKLALAAVNYLMQQPSVTNQVGSDAEGPWIFWQAPQATIENTSTSMVVINSVAGWDANPHNTARFPTLVVDIWTDPTRNSDDSVRKPDAALRAEAVYEALDRFLHLVNADVPGGGAVYWGTPEEIASKTGVRIISSERRGEPEVQPALNDEGAVIATVRYNVSI